MVCDHMIYIYDIVVITIVYVLSIDANSTTLISLLSMIHCWEIKLCGIILNLRISLFGAHRKISLVHTRIF